MTRCDSKEVTSMFSFRQKVLIGYLVIFIILILMMFAFVTSWAHKLIISAMDTHAEEIIDLIQNAPNDEALVKRLTNHKGLVFVRVSVINNEHKVLYDSHTKRLLGPQFSQEFIVHHPEILQAFEKGSGYSEAYSNLLSETFAYYAKAFDFHGKRYVIRTAFPYRYVTQLLNNFKIGFIIFATIILLLFCALTWFIIHYLTKPIHRIISVVRSYQNSSDENILPRIETKNLNPYDDFSQLALTLNSLSQKIQSHILTLVHERNEKEAILEALGEGVIAVDGNLNITYVNGMAFKLIEVTESPIGKQFKDLHLESCQRLIEECAIQKKAVTETMTITKEGKKIFLDLIAAPKAIESGAILVLQDKTAHHKISEMRRDFIANASHELKTPLTVILGFAETLNENPEIPQELLIEITSKIVSNSKRMSILIKDLLTLADIENIPDSRLSDCDILAIAQECAKQVKQSFPEAQIEIHAPKEETPLLADAELLELAMMNLIENAAKYSVPPAKINVTIEKIDAYLKISVIDQGIGIPLSDQEHVFDRFYTVDKAHSRQMGGSGLGLSIVKTIIEKHFGTITVSSELGKGTTFTIVLPKIPPHYES